MSDRAGHIRIGISGWNYPGWRGRFYPTGLRQRDELPYAAGRFDTIEINGTFYSLKRPEHFAQWRAATPGGFIFAVKGSRFITHMLKLRGVEAALANFFASGVLGLREKLGPLLWQLPARFAYDAGRLDAFLSLLPRDTEAAAALAGRHDHRVAGRALTETDRRRPLRHAIEIRHPSFVDPAFPRLLRRHGVALVFADTVEWPYAEDLTADFVYLRLHGSEELYASGYGDAALDRWAAHVALWAAGRTPPDATQIDPVHQPDPRPRDVYVYFDNDAKVRAPADAQALRQRLSAPTAASRYRDCALSSHPTQ
ncbi:MAG TPA: DUF72 domain-containing protein [Stellaceae bacterium]|jgi:uncharacterized protein YecE (DUF72 family)|nr:DUF72 domain-containing protein [Stellaceae bacterium]